MARYTLRFDAEGPGPATQIVFEAPDAGGALVQAHREAQLHDHQPWQAELWQGERKLCSIMQPANDVWRASP
ncbi:MULTISPECIES: hypothetical protein [Sphingomonadaceae]|uniref:hypothetical protein n=1 Tax=Sphingomonadaceae TaxID=41297 RepID=UPI00115B6E75|nr:MULTISPECIES: hypothetical protein [Sphingomonadaceae]QDK35413.1 hypothetical protein DM450_21940 [Sphingomonas sp. IC081]QSR20274.1 hypothetical protein CA833_24385 [Novosphingobium sp. KA1]